MASRNYLFLTPCSLTTSRTVKDAMLFASCTGVDDDMIRVVEQLRQQLTALARASHCHTSVLLPLMFTSAVEPIPARRFGPPAELHVPVKRT